MLGYPGPVGGILSLNPMRQPNSTEQLGQAETQSTQSEIGYSNALERVFHAASH